MAATGQCQGPRARPATPESELAVQIGPGFESGLAGGSGAMACDPAQRITARAALGSACFDDVEER